MMGSEGRIQVLDERGNSPLHLALLGHECNFDDIQQLLDEGADVNALNKMGRSPLLFYLTEARSIFKVDIIKLLLTRGADVKVKDVCGFTPLFKVLVGNSKYMLEIIKLLAAHGAFRSKYCDLVSNLDSYLCKSKCEAAVLKYFYDHGVHFSSLDDICSPPLNSFLYIGNLKMEIMEFLLTQGVDINKKDMCGCNVALRMILRNTNCNVEILNFIVTHGDGVQVQSCDFFGNSVLHVYLENRKCKLSVIKYLINHGVINVLNKWDESPLQCAFRNDCRRDVIKLLLDTGARLNPQNEECIIIEFNTFMSRKKKLEYVKLLIKYSLLENLNEDLKDYWNSIELSHFVSKCKMEIHKMDSETISDSTTLYQYLAVPRQVPLDFIVKAKCVQEENSVDINPFLCILYYNKYPLYREVISGYLIMQGTVKRPSLLNKLKEQPMYTKMKGSKQGVIANNAVALHYDTAWYVTQYLSDEDLLNLTSAFYNPVDDGLKFIDLSKQHYGVKKMKVENARGLELSLK